MKLSIETTHTENQELELIKNPNNKIVNLISSLYIKNSKFLEKSFDPEIYHLRFQMMYGIILEICFKMKLDEKTYFLTLEIFDHYSTKYNYESILEAECSFLCCFSLASKFSENHYYYIDLLMIKKMKEEYSKINFLIIEKNILQTINFNLNQPTSFEFLKLICKLDSNYICNSTNVFLTENQMDIFFSKAKELLIMILLNNKFLELSKFELALAIISVLRKRFGMKILIPSDLHFISSSLKEFIVDVCVKVIEEYVIQINPNFTTD